MQVGSYGFGTPFPVDGCRDDASGISGSFSTREETADGDVLQGFVVSDDANGSRSAGLHSDHYGFIGEKTVGCSSELLEPFAQTVADEGRHPEVQRR